MATKNAMNLNVIIQLCVYIWQIYNATLKRWQSLNMPDLLHINAVTYGDESHCYFMKRNTASMEVRRCSFEIQILGYNNAVANSYLQVKCNHILTNGSDYCMTENHRIRILRDQYELKLCWLTFMQTHCIPGQSIQQA